MADRNAVRQAYEAGIAALGDARAKSAAGAHLEAARSLEDAARAFRDCGDADNEGVVLQHVARYLRLGGAYGAALGVADRAARLLLDGMVRPGASLRLREAALLAELERALLAAELGGPATGLLRLSELTARLAEFALPPVGRAIIHFHAGLLYRELGELEAALENFDESADAYRELRDEVGEAQSRGERARTLARLGRLDEALVEALGAAMTIDAITGEPDRSLLYPEISTKAGLQWVDACEVFALAGHIGLVTEGVPAEDGSLRPSALARATDLLEGSGSQPLLALALADASLTTGTSVSGALGARLGIEARRRGHGFQPGSVGEWAAAQLGERGGQGRLAARAYRIAGLLHARDSDPGRAESCFSRAGEIDRNLGDVTSMVDDALCQASMSWRHAAAGVLLAGGAPGGTAPAVAETARSILAEAIQAADRDGADPLGRAQLATAIAVLDEEAAASSLSPPETGSSSFFVAWSTIDGQTHVWARPAGPAGAVLLTIGSAAGPVVVVLDAADLGFLHASEPAGSRGVLAALGIRPSDSGLAPVRRSAPVLAALSRLAAVALAHEHASPSDNLVQFLLSLQWASLLGLPALRELVGAEQRDGARQDAVAADAALSRGDRERLLALLSERDNAELVRAIERLGDPAFELDDLAVLGEAASALSMANRTGEADVLTPAYREARVAREQGATTTVDDGITVLASISEARSFTRWASTQARQGLSKPMLDAANLWQPHSQANAFLCTWLGSGQGATETMPAGWSAFHWKALTRLPVLEVQTWDVLIGPAAVSREKDT